MSSVYLLQNQHNHFLDRSGEWVPGENNQSLYRTEYKDEAINQKVEFSVKHPQLRIVITQARLNEKGKLLLGNSDHVASRNEIEGEAESTAELTENILDAFEQEFIFNTDVPIRIEPETEATTH